MSVTSTHETKTDIFGNTVTDDAGEPITVTETEDSETGEKKTFETSTKTNIFGSPVLDDAGQPIKVTEEK